jgi:hypothetical protein
MLLIPGGTQSDCLWKNSGNTRTGYPADIAPPVRPESECGNAGTIYQLGPFSGGHPEIRSSAFFKGEGGSWKDTGSFPHAIRVIRPQNNGFFHGLHFAQKYRKNSIEPVPVASSFYFQLKRMAILLYIASETAFPGDDVFFL